MTFFMFHVKLMHHVNFWESNSRLFTFPPSNVKVVHDITVGPMVSLSLSLPETVDYSFQNVTVLSVAKLIVL